jgi:hypothetical protein
MWNGAAVDLNKSAAATKITPTVKPLGTTMSDPYAPTRIFARSSKLVVPVNP